MRTRNFFMVLLSAVACTACTWAYDLKKEFRKEGGMLISPITNEPKFHPNGGFAILLSPDFATGTHAPNGPEFLKALNERLRKDEESMGHKYCQFGYKLSPMFWYHGVYAELSGVCLPNPVDEQATK